MPTLNPHPSTGEFIKSLFTGEETLTILMHKMTFIDIKSIISYFSAVLIPFAEGFIVRFGMKETGTL